MQALNQLNESVRCFKRCRELKPDCETSRAMYQAAFCELKMEEVSRERSDKLDETQKKLDQFYENMDLMRQNQYMISEEEESGGEIEMLDLPLECTVTCIYLLFCMAP